MKKILILLFLISILSGCSILKTSNFTANKQGASTPYLIPLFPESNNNIDKQASTTDKYIDDNKKCNSTPIQSYLDVINCPLLSQGVTVQWQAKIASRYSQIDGIKFCIVDDKHPKEKVDGYKDCDWFWLIPENLATEASPEYQVGWDGSWPNYMFKTYSTINPSEVDWDNDIFLITGKIDRPYSVDFGVDYLNRPIPVVVAIKIERVNKKIKIPYSSIEDFEKFPSFEEYPITEVFEGEPASVDLTSHPKGNMFRTALRLGTKEGPNFAGHYTVVTWGCGSPCQEIAVVDANTGDVYFSPFVSSTGSEYRLDSNLIIVNPPSVRLEYIKDSKDGKLASWEDFPSYYYKWENNQFIYLDSNESDDSFNYKFD